MNRRGLGFLMYVCLFLLMKSLQRHTKHQEKKDLQREARLKKYWMFRKCEEYFCFFKSKSMSRERELDLRAQEFNAV